LILVDTRNTVAPCDTDKAYIAGIIDGEGCFSITERLHTGRRSLSPTWTASLQISMVDEEAIKFISDRYKGRVYKFNAPKNSRFDFYRYDAVSQELKVIVIDTLTYLKTKLRQASIIISFLDTLLERGHPGYPLNQDIIDKRAFYSCEIKQLNQRMV
jgi:hypothetical protein